MARHLAAIGFVSLLFAAGCSSSGSSIEFTIEEGDQTGDIPFSASGEGVEEGIVCSQGLQSAAELTDVSGESIVEEDWFAMFDSAMDTGAVAEMDDHRVWTCADGSGSFDFVHHTRFDFATLEFEGPQDVGTWEIGGGSGDYTGLSGSGSAILDFDTGVIHYEGEVSG